jgi:hypothetical protein
MLDLLHSRLYAKPEDMELLRNEPEYVKNRYYTIIKTILKAPFRWTRQHAADNLHITKRQIYRIIRSYRSSEIPGLRYKSRCPKTTPNKSPEWIEKAVVAMKKLTGFGTPSISTLVNEQFRVEGSVQKVGSSLAYKICLRNNLPKPPDEKPPDWEKFDWKRPNNLVQSDLTTFNGIPILTMEDDHTRHAWSQVIADERPPAELRTSFVKCVRSLVCPDGQTQEAGGLHPIGAASLPPPKLRTSHGKCVRS